MPSFEATVAPSSAPCEERRPDGCGVIIFGASGDLVYRKLLPALFHLFMRELMPEQFYILGFARTNMNDDDFRNRTREALSDAHETSDSAIIDAFLSKCMYVSGDYKDPEAYKRLQKKAASCDCDFSQKENKLFYLALPPQLHPTVVSRLSECGLTMEGEDKNPWARVVFEKPFGHDLNSALELDKHLCSMLTPSQIFRIDHYLGKETVQSILMLRFANIMFEPLWNQRYIDNIQITVAESVGVEHRGGYYEQAGCLRDMFQNHMLQMLSLVTMEPPTRFEAEFVQGERVKLLKAIRPWSERTLKENIVRGQYTAGRLHGSDAIGYHDEANIAKDSQTETFVGMKLYIDNWRWQGVPIYMRSGKRLSMRESEVAVTFKRVPHSMFGFASQHEMPANILVMKIQPNEGVDLTIHTKQPGPKTCMASLSLSFKYEEVFGIVPPDAYERLLLDCMLGDRTLFLSSEGVEAAWTVVDPILNYWRDHPENAPLHPYKSGSWGPAASDDLLLRSGHQWRNPPEEHGTHFKSLAKPLIVRK
ncbi:glucose-6-phosphate dehydrogenase [Halodesulfovibrio sp.]|jgi:glucose-6-phosphate 1-dehydrogenase|uniref:glucose-6-phosphate dehydrogenase n=1 Tax=Halodesulfovibrio sp. TaxID=1912772 RepID=UPI0025F9A97B|nr:glucose-6-phosphate dehydrogenase [Halodesulfovibrio sp.]MCT4535616.1 glucose-6-phosphate dehydrogenase [Halodesulfovibrio sp.]MCT4626602.1 glucose-6-phosphate dehydrogenase [Halodesulfovibrio sp.]